jgi:hypothetical protein
MAACLLRSLVALGAASAAHASGYHQGVRSDLKHEEPKFIDESFRKHKNVVKVVDAQGNVKEKTETEVRVEDSSNGSRQPLADQYDFVGNGPCRDAVDSNMLARIQGYIDGGFGDLAATTEGCMEKCSAASLCDGFYAADDEGSCRLLANGDNIIPYADTQMPARRRDFKRDGFGSNPNTCNWKCTDVNISHTLLQAYASNMACYVKKQTTPVPTSTPTSTPTQPPPTAAAVAMAAATSDCTEAETTLGWSYGHWNQEFPPPQGSFWTWQDCASKCAQAAETVCTFWTLQLKAPFHCYLLSFEQAEKEDQDPNDNIQGHRNSACA